MSALRLASNGAPSTQPCSTKCETNDGSLASNTAGTRSGYGSGLEDAQWTQRLDRAIELPAGAAEQRTPLRFGALATRQHREHRQVDHLRHVRRVAQRHDELEQHQS